MMNPMNVEEEIRKIHERNGRIEADKAWEVSLTRRAAIAAFAYLVATAWLVATNDSKPLLKALVPAVGYIFSTLTLPALKKAWINKKIKYCLFDVSGKIIPGKNKGAGLGFPTINVKTSEKIPGGVYAGVAEIESKKYPAAVFVPLFDSLVEAHLLGFSEVAYGKWARITAHEKLRDVAPFLNNDQMKEFISYDVQAVKKLFES